MKHMMVIVTLGLSFYGLLAHPEVLAQSDSSQERRGWGYGFFAVGSPSVEATPILHIGAGGEGLVYKGLGVGAELGYLAPARAFRGGIGVLSVNGSYHFLKPSSPQKLVPFVTAGYSLGFREGVASALNFGGGVSYWMRDRVGLRLEFRDHVHIGFNAHFLEFRIGLTFR